MPPITTSDGRTQERPAPYVVESYKEAALAKSFIEEVSCKWAGEGPPEVQGLGCQCSRASPHPPPASRYLDAVQRTALKSVLFWDLRGLTSKSLLIRLCIRCGSRRRVRE